MDTKLKNADKISRPKKLKSFLLNRKVRTVVCGIVCILTAIIYLLGIRFSNMKNTYPYTSDGLYLHDYMDSYEFSVKKLSFYEAMCITSSFYLRNTDDNYKFQLSDSTFLNYTQEMKNNYKLDVKYNKKGKCEIDSDFWDFFVAFDGKYLTNIENLNVNKGTDVKELVYDLMDQYDNYCIRTQNNILTDLPSSDYNYYDRLNFTGIFQRYDYSFENSDGSDFPIGASGYDNLGRFIFQYYGYNDVKFYDSTRKDKKFSHISDYNVLHNINDYSIADGFESDEDYYIDELEGYEFTIYDDNPISIFFAPKPEQAKKLNATFKGIEDDYKRVILSLLSCCIILCVLCVYLAVVCGYNASEKKKWGYSVLFGKWYSEVQIICLIFMIISTIFLLGSPEFSRFLKYFITSNTKQIQLISCITFSICFSLCAGLAMGIISKFKSKTFIHDSLCLRLAKKLMGFIKRHIVNTKLFVLFKQKTIAQKLYTVTWIFIASTIAIIILFFISLSAYDTIFPGFFAILFVVYLIYALWYIITLFKGFSDINTLCSQIEKLSNDEDITDEISEYSIIYEDSKRLMNISENVKENVEKQVQSERMKIELVTNVSHDLKTPLTSIISYIDLLKKENLSDEARDYVNILDIKSQKLKNIVSDVFSLAKATSGIDVELEEIDGVILLQQVLGDNEDKITNSGKNLKTDILCDSAMINADGNKLYRVFQNLIDNALNYSMDGTRIFLKLERDENNMILTVKNTASYEMNFSPEEITERFTRGDKSRTDGGSGLGLSIAKSFTEACGGTFKIELDGDVFKAILKMPLITTNRYIEEL